MSKHLKITIALLMTVLTVVGFGIANASFNEQINYQGKLTDTNNLAVADGTYQMVFKLYTVSSGGTAIWTETRSGANEVQVTNGLFSVMLGEVTSLSGIDFDQTLYLGVTIEADAEMTPRKVLGAVPASFVSGLLDGLDSLQFLRSDEPDTMASSSTSTLLTINQSGTGNILDLQDGGSTVFTVLDGGNVGIGTTSPIAKLAVDGTGRFTDILTLEDTTAHFSTSLGYGNSNNALTITSPGHNDDWLLRAYGLNGANAYLQLLWNGTEQFGFHHSGRFGIGISEPAATLDIETPAADKVGIALLASASQSADLFQITSNGGTAGDLLTLNSSGFLGIGTTSPASKLDVWGDLRVGTSSTPTLFAQTSSGRVGIGTASPAAALHVQGALRLFIDKAWDLTPVSSGNVLSITSGTNGLHLAGNGLHMGPFGSTSSSNVEWVNDAGAISSIDNIRISLRGTTDRFEVYERNSASRKFVVNGDGNVGIGTSSPLALLTVGSSTSVSIPTANRYNSAFVSGDLEVLGTIYGGSFEGTIDPNFTAGSIVFASSTGILAEDNSNFFWDDTNNRLGIGTVSPSEALEVNGNIEIPTANGRIQASSDKYWEFNADGVEIDPGSGNWVEILDKFIVNDGGEALTVDSAGVIINEGGADKDFRIEGQNIGDLFFVDASADRIGIGTTSPTAQLDVRGSYPTSPLVNFHQQASDAVLKLTTDSTGAVFCVGGDSGSQCPNSVFTIDDEGFTRISGTNSGLSVEATSNSYAGAFTQADWSGGHVLKLNWDTASAGAGDLIIDAENNGTDVFTLDALGTAYFSGNVGIGTTSPASKLDVWGDLRVGTSSTPTLFAQSSAGRVGIGTVSPSSELHVIGNTRFGDDSTLAFAGGSGSVYIEDRLEVDGDAWVNGDITFGALSEIKGSGAGADPTLTFDSSNDYIYFTNSNVGIGTTTPASKLDVAGFINTDQYSGYKQAGNTILYGSSTTQSIFVGQGAGANLPSDSIWNVAVGYQALNVSSTSDFNTAIGHLAGQNNTGASNTFVGESAGKNNAALGNVFVGRNAGLSNTTGFFNTFLGTNSGQNNNGGSRNIFVGYEAGDNVTSGTKNIVIGTEIDAPSATASNQLSIGNLIFGTGLDGTGTTISSGNIGIGTTTPGAKLHSLATTEQLRLGYDASTYASFTVNSGGTLIMSTSGDTFTIGGNGSTINLPRMTINTSGIIPTQNQTRDLGSAALRWDNVFAGTGDFSDGLVATGTTTLSGHILPGADDTYDLGSDTLRWRDLYLGPSTLHIGTSGNESRLTFATSTNRLTFQNTTDSTTGFQFLDADGGTPILNVDTTNERLGLGIESPQNRLDLQGGLRITTIAGSRYIDINASNGSLSLNAVGVGGVDGYNFQVSGESRFTIGREIRGVGINTSAASRTDTLSALIANPVYNGIVLEGAASQSADYLQVKTNGASAGDLLTLNSSGFLGIGTTSPASKLTISDSTSGNSALRFEYVDSAVSADNIYGQILFDGTDAGGGANGTRARIQGLSEGSNGEAALTFSTAASGGSLTEKMRINKDGQVQIGTSTVATTKLSVQTTGSNDILNLFETGGEEVFTVLESGNVGIGTSSPSSPLSVQADTAEPLLRLTGTRAGTPVGVRLESTDSTLTGSTDALAIYEGSNFRSGFDWNTGFLRIQGNASLTGGSDAAPIYIGQESSPSIRLDSGAGSSFIYHRDVTRDQDWVIGYHEPSTDPNRYYGIAESTNLESDVRFAIAPGGNVGIGTTSPQNALHITKSTSPQLRLAYDDTSSNNYGTLGVDNTGTLTITAPSSNSQARIPVINLGSADGGTYRIQSNFGADPFGIGNALFQTSGANQSTIIGVLPNGTGDGSGMKFFTSSAGTVDKNLEIGVDNSDGYAYFTASSHGSSGSNAIVFKTEPALDVPTERMRILSTGEVGINDNTPSAQLDITPATTTTNALVIRGYAGQTANLQEWRTNGGSALISWIDEVGRLRVTNSGSASEPVVAIGSNADTLANVSLHIKPNNAAYNPLVITGLSGQSADLLQVTSDGGTAGDLFKVSSAGAVSFPGALLINNNYGFAADGRTTIAGGTEGAPALRFVGDTDTGLWNHVANTLVFSTGGTEAARFDASQRFGIGTTSPSHKLTVAGDTHITGALYDNSNSAGSNGHILQSNGSGFNWVATSTLGLGGGSGSGTVNSGTTGQVAYYAADGTAVSGTSTLSITDEKVGIGTTSPRSSLEIEGTNPGIILSDGLNGAFKLTNTSQTFYVQAINSDGGAQFNSLSITRAGAGTFNTSLTVPNAGLLVKDTSGSETLSFKPGSDLTANRTLTFTTGDANRILTINGNATLNDWFDQSVKTTASPTFDSLTVTNNVGIGTTTPGSLLHVSGNGELATFGDSTHADKYIIFRDDILNGLMIGYSDATISDTPGTALIRSGGKAFAISAGDTSDFGSISTADLVVASTGNVGIGSSTPSAKLTVDGTVRIGSMTSAANSSLVGTENLGLSYSSSGSGFVIENRVTSSSTGGAGFVAYSNDGAAIASGDRLGFNLFGGSVSGSAVANGGGIVAYADGAWGVGDAPTRLEFEVAPDGSSTRVTALTIKSTGNVGIGTSSPASKLDVWGDLRVGTSSTPTLFAQSSTGRVGIGTNAPDARFVLDVGAGTALPSFAPGTPSYRIAGADATSVLTAFNSWGAASNFIAQRAGGTRASPSATEAGASLFALAARGYDTTNLYGGGSKAAITMQSVNAWTSSDNSTKIIFQTTPEGSTTLGTDMTIAGGNVGIGTTSPGAKLHLSSSSGILPTLVGGTEFIVQNNGGDSDNSRIALISGHSLGASAIDFGDRDDSNDGSITYSNGLRALSFVTAASTRMTIDSAGNVGIASTSPAFKLAVNGTVAFTGLSSVSTNDALCLRSNGEVVNSANVDCSISSIRFKNSVTGLDVGLETLRELRPVSFKYNEDVDEDGAEHIGLIAEEVLEVEPRLVVFEEDGITPRTIRYNESIALVIKAVQELDLKVRDLENIYNAENGEVSATFFESLLAKFEEYGVSFTEALTKVKSLAAGAFTVGSAETPSGITIYDEVTGEPYCLKVSAGAMVHTAGECGAAGGGSTESAGSSDGPNIYYGTTSESGWDDITTLEEQEEAASSTPSETTDSETNPVSDGASTATTTETESTTEGEGTTTTETEETSAEETTETSTTTESVPEPEPVTEPELAETTTEESTTDTTAETTQTSTSTPTG